MPSNKLTPKQEKFCNAYIETGNASEAYRLAYSCQNMKSETVNRMAFELVNNRKIAARVAELQAELKAKSDVTKEEIIKLCADVLRGENITDYMEERDGKRSERTIPKTWAIERLCKMLGFDNPTKTEVTGKDGGPIEGRMAVENHKVIFERYSDD
nr:MAG TPA: Terminase small subunit [Caudoviricetes sp.]